MDQNSQDPVTNLFNSLGDPNETDYLADTLEDKHGETQSQRAVRAFIDESSSLAPSDMDRDHAYLYEIFSTHRDLDSLNRAVIRDTLCNLAILTQDQPRDDDENLVKTRHLEYLAWVAAGRKDETSPLLPVGAQDALSRSPIDHSILPETNLNKACAACGKNDAKYRCSRCHLKTEDKKTFVTYYCNTKCQSNDWAKHRKRCRILSRLHRAVSILDELVCLSSEAVLEFCRHPVDIRERNGMVMFQQPADAHDGPMAYLGRHVAGKVRWQDVAASRELFLAALASNSCMEIYGGSRRPFLDLVLERKGVPAQALGTCVEVVCFRPKNMHRPVYSFIGTNPPTLEEIQIMDFNSTLAHEALRVTLVDGTKLVIDPTGRQFGWKEFLAPWDTYLPERVHNLVSEKGPENLVKREVSIYDGPSLQAELDRYSRARIHEDPDVVITDLSTTVNKAVAACLNMHAKRDFNGFKAFLSLSTNEFQAARQSMMDNAKTVLNGHVEWFRGRKDFRLYLNPHTVTMEHKVAFGEQLCQALEEVWISDDEYDELKDDPSRLDSLWRDRWDAKLGPNYRDG
ncbi:hypothetical protein QBC37DRAFT_375564 [Rhypophila decipiens]|uniref:MYND-type domain-containing protein n=1 Tax=Rhypophila decipiens TaxID=261697 RepID=A0AAN6Y3D0_9PEZI|nr:hypothetical protein QBC37DRAFT_375564 [Rhypophila decipiens]